MSHGNWQRVIHIGKQSNPPEVCVPQNPSGCPQGTQNQNRQSLNRTNQLWVGHYGHCWTKIKVNCIQFSLCICCANWPRHKGFQGKTCWNFHGSGHFVKRIYTLRSLVRPGWSCMFITRRLNTGIKSAKKQSICSTIWTHSLKTSLGHNNPTDPQNTPVWLCTRMILGKVAAQDNPCKMFAGFQKGFILWMWQKCVAQSTLPWFAMPRDVHFGFLCGETNVLPKVVMVRKCWCLHIPMSFCILVLVHSHP